MVQGNYSQEAQTAHDAERERKKKAWAISNFGENPSTIKPMPLPSVAQTNQVRGMAPRSGRGKVRTLLKKIKSSMTKKREIPVMPAPFINSDNLHAV